MLKDREMYTSYSIVFYDDFYDTNSEIDEYQSDISIDVLEKNEFRLTYEGDRFTKQEKMNSEQLTNLYATILKFYPKTKINVTDSEES